MKLQFPRFLPNPNPLAPISVPKAPTLMSVIYTPLVTVLTYVSSTLDY